MMMVCWDCEQVLMLPNMLGHAPDPATGIQAAVRCLKCGATFEIGIRQTVRPDETVRKHLADQRRKRVTVGKPDEHAPERQPEPDPERVPKMREISGGER